jgi:uncharacterized cupin superfamily protein
VQTVDVYLRSILTTPLGPDGDLLLLDGPVQVGVWEHAPGELDGTTPDEHETMFMVAGRATVSHGDGEFDLSPGTLWTTPKRWASTWRIHQTVRKLYVIDRREGTAGDATHWSNASDVALPAGTPRPMVIDGSPVEASLTLQAHDRLETGVWSCTPGTFPFRRDGYHEVFCVLDGHATLQVDTGEGSALSFDLVPGSVMLTPAGTTGRWIVHETVRKAYTIITV